MSAATGTAKKQGLLYISPLAPLPLLCFFLFSHDLTLPCALLAAALHECGHLIALRLLGGRVRRIAIYPFGGEIQTDGKLFSYPQSMFLSFAGIAVNLACAPLAFSSLPQFFVLFGRGSLALALFNLLPVRRLDGGDILFNFLSLFLLPARAEAVVRVTSVLCTGALLALIVYGCLRSLFNPMLVLLGVYLLFCCFSR